MTLEEIRKEIDSTDRAIKELFLKRMELSQKVAQTKMATADTIWKPERERQLISGLTADVPEELRTGYASFLKKLMEISRKYQYGLTLAATDCYHIPCSTEPVEIHRACYAGLPCSYGESAAKWLFGDKEIFNRATFDEVFQAVAEGAADVGVVPLENSTAGSINEVYDLLLKHDLYINYGYIKKVDHCLAALPGAKLENIAKAYSHPQALAQSNEYLKGHGIQPQEESNTAVAASKVAAMGDLTAAAVCSKEAAEQYGLTVLAESINHSKGNATRFVAVTRRLVALEEHNKISVVFTCPHQSGSLASVLGMFADYGVNLTEIHSRPDGKNPWNYMFYVDFTGNLLREDTRALLFQLTQELPYLKILGSYTSQELEENKP